MIGFKSDFPTLFIGPTPYGNQFGRIGIGITDPQATLDVNGGILCKGFAMPQARIEYGWVLTTDERGIATWAPPQSETFWFPTENGNIYRLNSNVGIGMVNPLSRLEVKGQVSIGYHVQPQQEENNLIVEGKVGIGTALPEEKLHVAGTVLVEGFSMPQDGIENGFVLTTNSDGKGSWVPNQYLWEQGVGDDIYRELGYVGIGINNPNERLHVSGNIQVDNNIVGYRTDYQPLKIMANSSDINGAYISLSSIYDQVGSIKLFARGSSGRIEFHNQNRLIMSIRENNNVYFGNPDNPTNIFVNGEVNASLVRVTVDTWEDRVFNPDYRLLTIYEVEAFIQANHHLPDIPSEQQVIEEGIDIGEMNALLLKKIEELTLYVIELKKENDEIKKKMDVIKTQ